jgi:preprotein translocase subunit Sec61beta
MAARDKGTLPEGPPRRAGFLATMRAVLWSFFGVRRGSEYEKDAVRLNPVYVIIAGIGAAALFVLTLVLVVRMVVS